MTMVPPCDLVPALGAEELPPIHRHPADPSGRPSQHRPHRHRRRDLESIQGGRKDLTHCCSIPPRGNRGLDISIGAPITPGPSSPQLSVPPTARASLKREFTRPTRSSGK